MVRIWANRFKATKRFKLWDFGLFYFMKYELDVTFQYLQIQKRVFYSCSYRMHITDAEGRKKGEKNETTWNFLQSIHNDLWFDYTI